VIETRCILVEGGPAAPRTQLAQRLSLQLGAQDLDHELRYEAGRGHPLRRPWSSDEYADAATFMETLVLQWENFALRATAPESMGGGGLWVFDGALFRAPADLLAAGAVEREAAEAFAERLLGALASLSPVLLYHWHPETDPGDDRALMDGIFGRLTEHRALLNASRADDEGLLEDALAFLGLPRRDVTLADGLGAALAGRYGDGAAALELRSESDRLLVDGLPAPLAGAPRSLLPTVDGTLLVAGADLELRPSLGDDGRPRGLLARSGDPRLDDLPDFLERSGE
jgi:hypothetical protein